MTAAHVLLQSGPQSTASQVKQMEMNMQFKSKAQLAALKAEETNAQMTNGGDPTQQPELIPIPLLTLEGLPTLAAEDAAKVAQGEPVEDKFVSFDVPDYPKSIYDSAHIENEMMDFNTQLGNANRPVIKDYTPPPVPAAIAKATLAEMEAGRARVAEFAAVEGIRRAAVAARPKEPWEGNTTQVFRPAVYVPDPRGVDRTGTLRTITNG